MFGIINTIKGTVKGLKGTVVSRGCPPLNGRSLEITLSVPLNQFLLYKDVCLNNRQGLARKPCVHVDSQTDQFCKLFSS